MDAHLLDAVAEGDAANRVRRRHELLRSPGPRPITEDAPPQPSASGRCLAPAFHRLDGYVAAGMPIAPRSRGGSTGDASWFREWMRAGNGPAAADYPIRQGRPMGVADSRPRLCPRAGASCRARRSCRPGTFVVNTDPIRVDEFAETFARLANRRLRVWRCPPRRAGSSPVRFSPIP